MKYLFEQKQGNSTILVVVEDPIVTNGTVYATKIGGFAGWDDKHEKIYESCPPARFIAGGGAWNMTEYQGKLL